MSISFSNVKEKKYFIKKKLTKKGNTTYYMTKKEDEECLDKIPEGYEVFEKYDSGMMFIRKVKDRLFDENEIKIIESELKKNETVLDFRLDIHGDTIKIYTVEDDPFTDSKKDDGSFLSRFRNDNMIHLLRRFEERMKIKIEKEEGEKIYVFERFCYRGRIDDWITIAYDDELKLLAKEYLPHLGKESYFNLM